MDAAVAAVLGAGLGVCGTLAGTVITARYQVGREVETWKRQRKDEYYGNAIRSLLRARNRRSGVTAEGASFISKEDTGKFFDDLVDAQHAMSMLLTACGAPRRELLTDASASLDRIVDTVVGTGPSAWAGGSVPMNCSESARPSFSAARTDIED